MTALGFPAEFAVGEVWWEGDRETGAWGHLPAIGVIDVPDGTAVQLNGGRGYGEEAVGHSPMPSITRSVIAVIVCFDNSAP